MMCTLALGGLALPFPSLPVIQQYHVTVPLTFFVAVVLYVYSTLTCPVGVVVLYVTVP